MQKAFETRVSLIDPTLLIKEKLTSDTIFQFLNAYTKRYVKQIYLQGDQVGNGTRAQKKSIDSLKSLITRQVLTGKTDANNSDNYTVSFVLPDDYFLYIRSNSLVTSTYRQQNMRETEAIPNEIIDVEDASKIITTPYNHVILRNPQVIMHSDDDNVCLNVIHDMFTTIQGIDLVYYRAPKEFNVINVDNKMILDHCELPDSMHIEIVEGAVEMFITEAKYRLNMKQENK